MSQRYGSPEDEDIDVEDIETPQFCLTKESRDGLRNAIAEFMYSQGESLEDAIAGTTNSVISAHLLIKNVLNLTVTPTSSFTYSNGSARLNLQLDRIPGMPAETAKKYIADKFSDEGYADHLVGDQKEVRLGDLNKYLEIDVHFINQETSVEKLPYHMLALSVNKELRIPIANAMQSAIAGGLVSDTLTLYGLRNGTYKELPTKYLIKGLKTACTAQPVDYNLVEKMKSEWKRVMDDYRYVMEYGHPKQKKKRGGGPTAL